MGSLGCMLGPTGLMACRLLAGSLSCLLWDHTRREHAAGAAAARCVPELHAREASCPEVKSLLAGGVLRY